MASDRDVIHLKDMKIHIFLVTWKDQDTQINGDISNLFFTRKKKKNCQASTLFVWHPGCSVEMKWIGLMFFSLL